jgi:cytochrome c biogenesis protein CcmG/thiol:disulfide interchange protein DsbE
VVSALLLFGCSDSRRGIYPGEIAPDVKGVDLQGATTSLHAIKGKALLVNFWATWCAPCMQELPALQSLHTKLRDRGFQVVGVAVGDSAENIREAVARFGITFPVIIDEAGLSKRKFEVKGLPESFVLDAEHRVLLVQDPGDGSPVTKIIGPREWTQNRALQLFQALVQ